MYCLQLIYGTQSLNMMTAQLPTSRLKYHYLKVCIHHFPTHFKLERLGHCSLRKQD